MSDFNEALYFRDLNRYPTLTPQEESALLKIIKTGETEEIRKSALQRLIRGNLRFVVSVARKYQGRGLSLLDLINEGNLGLFKAAKRFDMDKDVKFISYAVWWIRQSIQKALFEQVGAVRIPPNKLALVNRFKRALMQNGGDYEKTIAMEEFAPYERDIVEVMEKIVDISLDAPIGDDAGGGSSSADSVSTLMDVLGSDGGGLEAARLELRELEDLARARRDGDVAAHAHVLAVADHLLELDAELVRVLEHPDIGPVVARRRNPSHVLWP